MPITIEHANAKTLTRDVLAIIQKHLDTSLYRVFYFGSRVNGRHFERSDIDIGIEGPDTISSAIMEEIKSDIENLPCLYKIDIVDFKNVSEEFKRVAIQHREFIS